MKKGTEKGREREREERKKCVGEATTAWGGGEESLSPPPPGEGKRCWRWASPSGDLRVDHVTMKKIK